MINYFIYTIVSLGCAFALYYLLLRKQKTFQFNRFFLIGSLILCLIAPFLEIEIFNSVPSITEIPIKTISRSKTISEDLKEVPFENIEVKNPSQTSALFYVFLIVSLFFLFRFLRNLIKIYSLTRGKHEHVGSLKLIRDNNSVMVSSFFNYVFVNTNQDLENEEFLSILRHETAHFRELHTLDLIIVELLICFIWFNPFIWLYKKAILQNHEYSADDKSVSSGINIEIYSNTIINLRQKEYRIPLTSGINFIQIKNRIIMLHQSKSSILNRTLKISSVILLFTCLFAFSSYKELKQPLIVVIDAGHGGHDSGQISENSQEKDIVLNISNILKSMSDEKVKIITTRNDDNFFSLSDRVGFIKMQKADLVISLHCNANSDNTVSGVKAYYYKDNNFERYSESMIFSSIIASKVMEQGFETAQIAPANFKIMREIESPTVYLGIGFLTNPNDFMILNDVKKQENIAKSIYNAILNK